MALLGDDDSLGQEAADDVKEDSKCELVLLYVALKKLDADLDFTLLINPLLMFCLLIRALRWPSLQNLRSRLIV